MMIVIANWFVAFENLAFDITHQKAEVESARKWRCNFMSVNDDDSVVQMHQGLCRDLLSGIAEAKVSETEIELQVLKVVEAILASYYPRKM